MMLEPDAAARGFARLVFPARPAGTNHTRLQLWFVNIQASDLAVPDTSERLASPVLCEMKTAVVSGTGTRHGLGRGILHAFLQEGWRCVGIDISQHQEEQTDPVLQAHQQQYKFIQADISDEKQVQTAIQEASSFLQRSINCLVNNAGIAQPYLEGNHSQRIQSWQNYIATNLSGAFLMSEACLPFMPHGDASIVHISSVRAHFSEPNSEGYGSAKAGLIGLTRAQAVSLAQHARVNAILPGWIDTSGGSMELTKQDTDWHPVGRIGAPKDIAQAVLFLADSSKAGFITGQELTIDGGVTAKLVYPE
ncbi:hypothetical protein WJX74_000516 [Apatococcus lobatus]|uniref:Uncharacterized protein n=1 Tax=Apatococcus lobatus TaxID=904363 RepID=A0AAW1QI13_9CHLO